ncbi:ABC transporter permease [Haloarchaeobius iranensis]|uniref:Amino acid/amide ABC transporter membrane protein 1, HAAT family /amino acid/amide ABC transporter membrane protein 2, HAAT family n=1 Tax=Haloarchaeobius iranensis TaxID=996166 RepID=A0A1H0AT12_9EURY|nr:ABC transporter permease [Haloarchaeobius iranensis]SDN36534.1 amino acid/amide ABC transporter membrane protein 1, HAAT family /amino acid/amide ABC transporter membrane protein 2, HAAT family [Haloarchaeobius iranensis]
MLELPLVTAGETLDQFINGLTVGMVYVLLAAGLSIIFGVMDVINFAHGELLALGAYFAVAITTAGIGNFWVALLVAPLAVAIIGGAMERLTIRPLYGRDPLYHILLTFGLVLIFVDAIELIWGTQPFRPLDTGVLSGTITILGFQKTLYSYFVIVMGAVVAAGAWLVLERTRFGLVVRAGSMDRDMVRHLGIDIDRYYTLVFAFGAFLAAVGGVVFAGRQSVGPGMGGSVIIPAFIVVVLGGLGSFRGAVAGGLLVGVVQSFVRWQVPFLEGLVVFLLMIGVLLIRPQGLFGSPEWHDPGEGGELLTAAGSGVLSTRRRRLLGGGMVAVLAIAPLGIGVLYNSYVVNTIVVDILIWGLFALSLDLVMGYTGLVSLGHVLFYGLGAYATVLFAVYLLPSIWLALVAGILVAALIAWVVGYLSIRVSGVYFSMITLAFAELFASLALKMPGLRAQINPTLDSLGLPTIPPLTNGDNGIGADAITYGLTGGPEFGDVSLLGEIHLYYYVILALVVGSYLVSRRLIDAPFGSVLQAIRESEQRASFLGYDTTMYKRRAFVVSGALAGLAGGLRATQNLGRASPGFLDWLLSGEVIVMTLLGGMGTLYGPMIGAAGYLSLEELLLSNGIDQWQGVLGIVFVLFVIFVPRGIVSIPSLVKQRMDSSSEAPPEGEPAEVSD